MYRPTTYIRVCLTMWFFLGLTVTVGAQNRPRGDQQTRGMPPVPSGSVVMATEQRTALVIGNAVYTNSPSLRNPVNDAKAMATTLEQIGFQVEMLTDVNREAMLKGIARLGTRLKQGGVGLFFFAGHGLQVKGENYLVPIDAPIDSDTLEYSMVPAQSIVDRMEEAKNAVNILIFDACRNNPFVSRTRSGQQGLAQMQAPNGSIVAFAASPSQVASDGRGANGLYTAHLLQHMRTPGMTVEQMFKAVRIGVSRQTNSKQVPQEWTTLERDFMFVPATQSSSSLSVAPIVSSLVPPSGGSLPPSQPAPPGTSPLPLVTALPPQELQEPSRLAKSFYIDHDNPSRYLVPHLEEHLQGQNRAVVRKAEGSSQLLKIFLRSTVANDTAYRTKITRMQVQLTVQNNAGNEVLRHTQVVQGSSSTDYEQALQDAARIWLSTLKQKGVLDELLRAQ